MDLSPLRWIETADVKIRSWQDGAALIVAKP